ncbi:MAG: hypothetical protein JRI46_00445 [Deltaproteobacteria bacterium]|nr:hypothetical protein [Deltaproteobacteria bacterium]
MKQDRLWDKQEEEEFFRKTLEIATPEQLFYVTEDGRYLAYWPKGYKGVKTTLQSRNAFIGSYTERWISRLIEPIADEVGGFPVQGVICEEIGLTKRSPADVAICKNRGLIQKPENILLLIEVKMSVVWNWEYDINTQRIISIGDYTSHQGNPGLLRSDTMLKAGGKSINIKVSDVKATKIPIIVFGNTPITKNYYEKVDHLKRAGIIQGFFSVNPYPLDDPKRATNIKGTPQRGFLRFDTFSELKEILLSLLKEEREFFSGKKTKSDLGRIIEMASQEPTYEKKAERFLQLLREVED